MTSKYEFKLITNRDPKFKATDISALKALAQAAVNVELFTIPLYMTTLYSLHGTHQVNTATNLYQGRLWPGMGTSADPKTDNERVFNGIFSVYIAEMLHLQLASNICNAVGVTPTFTSPLLVDQNNYTWTCYGPDNTTIPHILDFKDTKTEYSDYKVNLDTVTVPQINLFLAIEQNNDLAADMIADDKIKDYFPPAPFEWWEENFDETHLRPFGTIGYMYLCLAEYLTIGYSDNTWLWQDVFKPASVQNDLFNNVSPYTKAEYPGMRATVDQGLSPLHSLLQVIDMINGITDQGEGSGVVPTIKKLLAAAMPMLFKAENKGQMLMGDVDINFQPDPEALEYNYPSYDSKGVKQQHSNDAGARYNNGKVDHFTVFKDIMALVAPTDSKVVTWEKWYADGGKWDASMLEIKGVDSPKNLPSTTDVANALNQLKEEDDKSADKMNFNKLSQVVVGAIKGITTSLNAYWAGEKGSSFPYAAMQVSGDKMSICWAIFGKVPNLISPPPLPPEKSRVPHACQGINYDLENIDDPAVCATMSIVHSCGGTNTCKAQGGCGYVGKDAKGDYSAPGDNQCKTYGGCAVPISASQVMYPFSKDKTVTSGTMDEFDISCAGIAPTPIGDTVKFSVGDLIYDTAWQAYADVMLKKHNRVVTKPDPSALRLAMPPNA